MYIPPTRTTASNTDKSHHFALCVEEIDSGTIKPHFRTMRRKYAPRENQQDTATSANEQKGPTLGKSTSQCVSYLRQSRVGNEDGLNYDFVNDALKAKSINRQK